MRDPSLHPSKRINAELVAWTRDVEAARAVTERRVAWGATVIDCLAPYDWAEPIPEDAPDPLAVLNVYARSVITGDAGTPLPKATRVALGLHPESAWDSDRRRELAVMRRAWREAVVARHAESRRRLREIQRKGDRGCSGR